MQKLTDVVDATNPIVSAAIDTAIRTTEGCWIYQSVHNDSWGRPWMMINSEEATRVDVAMFEWYHGASIPAGYDVESTCGKYGCCNPECLILWELDENDV